jgi:hypothetical protein
MNLVGVPHRLDRHLAASAFETRPNANRLDDVSKLNRAVLATLVLRTRVRLRLVTYRTPSAEQFGHRIHL